MNRSEQGAHFDRHVTIPRTLVFLTSYNQSGERVALLIKGAPTKRLWANRYNGLGGHIEANEDVLRAAQREVAEEAGFEAQELTLRGVVHIDTGSEDGVLRPGVMVFVFHGETEFVSPAASGEGQAEWVRLDQIDALPVVDDLPDLIRHALGTRFFFGHYAPDADGNFQRTFA